MLLLEKKSEMVFEKYDVLVPFYVQLYFTSSKFPPFVNTSPENH